MSGVSMPMKWAALTLLGFLTTGSAAKGPLSCRDEVGAAKARTYVSQCLDISQSTHPPCNASNPCALIIDEIVHGCQLYFGTSGYSESAAHGVKFCKRYLKSSRKPATSVDE